jgi:hypothetical protein
VTEEPGRHRYNSRALRGGNAAHNTRAPAPHQSPAVNVAVFNVVEILKRSKNPLKTADIYDELVTQGL